MFEKTPAPLNAARMFQPFEPDRLVRPDGRRLAWAEAGDPAGFPVFAFHGLPGSRMQRHPRGEIAARAGIRVIHPERPGFGCSDPQPRRGFRHWAEDVAALADHLCLGRFAVAGVSAGGPYALACAALLSGRVVSCALVSSVGPPGSMTGRSMTRIARLGFSVGARRAQWLLGPVALAARYARRHPDRYVDRVAARLCGADADALADPEIRAMFRADLPEALRQGGRAVVEDLGILASPWDFDPRTVCCPVRIWHGDEDRMVPPEAGRALKAMIAHAELHEIVRGGHFMVFALWPETTAWLADIWRRASTSIQPGFIA